MGDMLFFRTRRATPAPAGHPRRSQGLPGLVFEDKPGPGDRGDLFTRGHTSRRHTATSPSSRSTARRAGS